MSPFLALLAFNHSFAIVVVHSAATGNDAVVILVSRHIRVLRGCATDIPTRIVNSYQSLFPYKGWSVNTVAPVFVVIVSSDSRPTSHTFGPTFPHSHVHSNSSLLAPRTSHTSRQVLEFASVELPKLHHVPPFVLKLHPTPLPSHNTKTNINNSK